jgi:hypothetical protein
MSQYSELLAAASADLGRFGGVVNRLRGHVNQLDKKGRFADARRQVATLRAEAMDLAGSLRDDLAAAAAMAPPRDVRLEKLQGDFRRTFDELSALSRTALEKERSVTAAVEEGLDSGGFGGGGSGGYGQSKMQQQQVDLNQYGLVEVDADVVREMAEEVQHLERDIHIIEEIYSEMEDQVLVNAEQLDSVEDGVEATQEQASKTKAILEKAKQLRQQGWLLTLAVVALAFVLCICCGLFILVLLVIVGVPLIVGCVGIVIGISIGIDQAVN